MARQHHAGRAAHPPRRVRDGRHGRRRCRGTGGPRRAGRVAGDLRGVLRDRDGARPRRVRADPPPRRRLLGRGGPALGRRRRHRHRRQRAPPARRCAPPERPHRRRGRELTGLRPESHPGHRHQPRPRGGHPAQGQDLDRSARAVRPAAPHHRRHPARPAPVGVGPQALPSPGWPPRSAPQAGQGAAPRGAVPRTGAAAEGRRPGRRGRSPDPPRGGGRAGARGRGRRSPPAE